ncbi:MAG TPA: hypothetical protein VNW46_15200 [Gemmatimonadaceae bacterium]|jgi:hypothetical protein|nr:hypothetical protein [Gemmatimonadaceae bacterium]
MTERLRRVTHRGCTILYTDYSNFTDWKDWKSLIDAERVLMSAEPLGSVRAIAVFSGSRFSSEVVDAIKQLAVSNRPHMKASALVGMSDLQRSVFLKGIERTSDRTFGLFDTVDEALDWLASQA